MVIYYHCSNYDDCIFCLRLPLGL